MLTADIKNERWSHDRTAHLPIYRERYEYTIENRFRQTRILVAEYASDKYRFGATPDEIFIKRILEINIEVSLRNEKIGSNNKNKPKFDLNK